MPVSLTANATVRPLSPACVVASMSRAASVTGPNVTLVGAVYASADADVVGAGTATTNGESEVTSPHTSPFRIRMGITSTGWPFTKWIR